jgi:hypothetical protein
VPCCRGTDLFAFWWPASPPGPWAWGGHILVLAAAALNRQDFTNGNPINWYTIDIAFVLAGMVALYVAMSIRKMTQRAPVRNTNFPG